MNSKKSQLTKLGNLGKILSFSPPLVVSEFDIDEFKSRFDRQLHDLITNDEFAANQSLLLGGEKKSAEQILKVLLTPYDETWNLQDFIKELVPVWKFLKSELRETPFPFDPDDFIAKLLILTDIIRRKDATAAFGSRSHAQRDEVLRPSNEISEKMKHLEISIDNESVYGLSPTIKNLFIEAQAAFDRFNSSLKGYKTYLEYDDKKFEHIYVDLQKSASNKGYVTQIINALIKDLIGLNFEVGTKYKDGSWIKKLADSQRYEAKKK